jgi:hypothetical protein
VRAWVAGQRPAPPAPHEGKKRSLLPLPYTRSWPSRARSKAMTSTERSPCLSIRPTTARSRAGWKLDQKRAASSTESGMMLRLGYFTRSLLSTNLGRPRPIGLRCRKG